MGSTRIINRLMDVRSTKWVHMKMQMGLGLGAGINGQRPNSGIMRYGLGAGIKGVGTGLGNNEVGIRCGNKEAGTGCGSNGGRGTGNGVENWIGVNYSVGIWFLMIGWIRQGRYAG